jgi:hypothetical protein
MIFENDRHLRVGTWERERVKVKKYGEKRSTTNPFFQSLVSEARSAGTSKTAAKIVKKQAMLTGHRHVSDTCFIAGCACRN